MKRFLMFGVTPAFVWGGVFNLISFIAWQKAFNSESVWVLLVDVILLLLIDLLFSLVAVWFPQEFRRPFILGASVGSGAGFIVAAFLPSFLFSVGVMWAGFALGTVVFILSAFIKES